MHYRRLGNSGIKVSEIADVKLVTGQTVQGRLRYVSKSASATTRTLGSRDKIGK